MFIQILSTFLSLFNLQTSMNSAYSYHAVYRNAYNESTRENHIAEGGYTQWSYNSLNTYKVYTNTEYASLLLPSNNNWYTDKLYLWTDTGGQGYCGYLEWYFNPIDNDATNPVSYVLKSKTQDNQPINLKIMVLFTFIYNDNEVHNDSVMIDFTSLEWCNTITKGTENTSVINLQNIQYTKVGVSFTFIPVSYDEYYNAQNGGYNNGYNDGYSDGYDVGKDDGYNNGYQNGYTNGWTDADNTDATAVTIFSGIISVGLLPVNFFLAILNFEVFGINIGAFVSALLTVAIVVIITRMVVNGGNGKD